MTVQLTSMRVHLLIFPSFLTGDKGVGLEICVMRPVVVAMLIITMLPLTVLGSCRHDNALDHLAHDDGSDPLLRTDCDEVCPVFLPSGDTVPLPDRSVVPALRVFDLQSVALDFVVATIQPIDRGTDISHHLQRRIRQGIVMLH